VPGVTSSWLRRLPGSSRRVSGYVTGITSEANDSDYISPRSLAFVVPNRKENIESQLAESFASK
jgi:hypothetical protein